MRHEVQELLSETEQIAEILSGANKIMYHDWTGDELVIHIPIPKGNKGARKKAADWLAFAIHRNIRPLACEAILDAQQDAMGKIAFHEKEAI